MTKSRRCPAILRRAFLSFSFASKRKLSSACLNQTKRHWLDTRLGAHGNKQNQLQINTNTKRKNEGKPTSHWQGFGALGKGMAKEQSGLSWFGQKLNLQTHLRADIASQPATLQAKTRTAQAHGWQAWKMCRTLLPQAPLCPAPACPAVCSA